MNTTKEVGKYLDILRIRKIQWKPEEYKVHHLGTCNAKKNYRNNYCLEVCVFDNFRGKKEP